jgi:glyoxylase-like metal-dependent hydrolase (beta-lactamase superfamily II)
MSLLIHSIGAGIGSAYLIESKAGLVLVDAGSRRSESKILRRMQALGRYDLRLIFITHAHLDHYGSAAAIRRLTGAPVAIHPADADAMAKGETRLGSVRGWGRLVRAMMPLIESYLGPEPTPADILLEEGDSLGDYGLDGVVLHTPGHTPGSTSLLVEGRIAFIGDLLSTALRPYVQRYYASDWSLVAESLRRLMELKLEWVYGGHGLRPLSGEAFKSLDASTP